MKVKHPCESEWYTKALRHLLVQYKESIGLVICQFWDNLQNPPSYHKEEAAFIFQPKAICSSPQILRDGSSFDLSAVKAVRQEILACLIQSPLKTGLSTCVLECVCSLRRLQTGRCCLSFTAHAEWQWRFWEMMLRRENKSPCHEVWWCLIMHFHAATGTCVTSH